ncbi:MAG: hypothetical protein II485_00455 [Firmicutes bacterium]|nr:hypothetical protein [Bacillota bacterium]
MLFIQTATNDSSPDISTGMHIIPNHNDIQPITLGTVLRLVSAMHSRSKAADTAETVSDSFLLIIGIITTDIKKMNPPK